MFKLRRIMLLKSVAHRATDSGLAQRTLLHFLRTRTGDSPLLSIQEGRDRLSPHQARLLPVDRLHAPLLEPEYISQMIQWIGRPPPSHRHSLSRSSALSSHSWRICKALGSQSRPPPPRRCIRRVSHRWLGMRTLGCRLCHRRSSNIRASLRCTTLRRIRTRGCLRCRRRLSSSSSQAPLGCNTLTRLRI